MGGHHIGVHSQGNGVGSGELTWRERQEVWSDAVGGS